MPPTMPFSSMSFGADGGLVTGTLDSSTSDTSVSRETPISLAAARYACSTLEGSWTVTVIAWFPLQG